MNSFIVAGFFNVPYELQEYMLSFIHTLSLCSESIEKYSGTDKSRGLDQLEPLKQQDNFKSLYFPFFRPYKSFWKEQEKKCRAGLKKDTGPVKIYICS